MPASRTLGSKQEDWVVQYLHSKGWTILKRRYKAIQGEIDIVARDENTIVFVEVKYRSSSLEYGLLSVTQNKVERLKLAADQFLREYSMIDHQVRFDGILVIKEKVHYYRSWIE